MINMAIPGKISALPGLMPMPVPAMIYSVPMLNATAFTDWGQRRFCAWLRNCLDSRLSLIKTVAFRHRFAIPTTNGQNENNNV